MNKKAKERFRCYAILDYQREAPRFSLFPKLLYFDNTPYIVTYMGGEASLAAQYDGLFPEEPREALRQILEVAISLLNRLKPIHDNRRLYVDIKPDNILLFSDEPTRGESRSVALFDFDSIVDLDAARRGEAMIYYSPRHAAPELERSWHNDLGAHTDIFGVGSVLLWMLVGSSFECLEPPYLSSKLSKAIAESFNSRYHCATLSADELGKISAILEKSLCCDGRKRYQSADEMRDELISALETLGCELGAERMDNDDKRDDWLASYNNILNILNSIEANQEQAKVMLQVIGDSVTEGQHKSQANHDETHQMIKDQTAHNDESRRKQTQEFLDGVRAILNEPTETSGRSATGMIRSDCRAWFDRYKKNNGIDVDDTILPNIKVESGEIGQFNDLVSDWPDKSLIRLIGSGGVGKSYILITTAPTCKTTISICRCTYP